MQFILIIVLIIVVIFFSTPIMAGCQLAVAVPANTALPVITGTPQVGQTLTGRHGIWTNSPTSYTDQWYRAGAAIPGATSLTYSPQTADVGSTLMLGEFATNAVGSSFLVMSAATTPVTAPSVPVNIAPPAISGTPQVGQTLTGAHGSWTNSPTSYTDQWYRAGAAIPGATSLTYSPQTADVGSTLTLGEIAANAAGSSAQAMSAATAPVTAASSVPVNTSPPAISGTPQVGQTLTGAHGSWTNSPTSFSDQWYRAGAAIPGATSLTYSPQTADVGSTLTLGEIAANAAGSSAQAMSAATAPVTPPPATGIVNGSFESPSIASYAYRPTGSSWTFIGDAGIQHNGSAWGAPNAPDGVQTAFLQDGVTGGNGTISQLFTAPAAGTYTISFYSALRTYRTSPTIMSFNVTMDGTNIGNFSPTSTAFSQFTTSPVLLTAGTHTLSFVGTGTAPDTSDFIDFVTLNSAPAQLPPTNNAPPTITGTPQVGQTLIGAHGNWTNSPTSFADQWYRAGTPIPGATSLSYTPQTADVGSTLTLGEIATNTAGSSVQAMSAPTMPVANSTSTPVAVATYHYDNLRTGWNNQESILVQQNVNQTSFGIIGTATLDDQVDAQPLVVPNQTIAGGTHDVVYIATENNSVYAIDATSGAILLQKNLGPPVPSPLNCGNNGPNVGINSTPVIDLAKQLIYVITYINVNGNTPTYQLHALSLSTLTDVAGSPTTVSASHTLVNGSVYRFNAVVQRQRAGLLEANGNIYAAFASFCDFSGSASRGWILGWNATTLAPLASNELTDTRSTGSFFLSSIWMSGYGIAADPAGTLFFSTGNSDNTYDGVTNIQESVVNINGNLNSVLGLFTPSNVGSLDGADLDVSAGGVMLLPQQSGNTPFLAVIGGKDGRLFLLNRANLGGFTPGGPDKVLDVHPLSRCWCGPSYFTGSDGINRIVTSHGSTLQTWSLNLSSAPTLVMEGTTNIVSGQDPGFFTVVSSNGNLTGSHIIWAVGRPTGPGVNLYAFGASPINGAYPLLYTSPAGSWPFTGGNANIVPVVANGKVYVAAYQKLTIFGILPGQARIAAAPSAKTTSQALARFPNSPYLVSGTLLTINGTMLTVKTRVGKTVTIDASQATKNQRVGNLEIGTPYTIEGSVLEGNGVLQAISIYRAKGSSGELWPPDH